MIDLVERLDRAEEAFAEHGGYDEFARAISEAKAEIERLREAIAEARAMASLGCDAADGGAHTIIVQGSYKFCSKCGYTIRNPKLSERARSAEARAATAEAEIERLREGIRDCLDGNYDRVITGHKCKHERVEWEDCEPCIDEHLEALLRPHLEGSAASEPEKAAESNG